MLINTVSGLLEKILKIGRNEIEEYLDIKHPGMIGNMYEGLTKKILDHSLFPELNLSVGSGKIYNSSTKKYSKQIDCMIYSGFAEQVPYTNEIIVDMKNVVAVVEVKKNLYKKELEDAYDNLLCVSNMMDTEGIEIDIVRDAFVGICGIDIPKDIKSLTYNQQMIYHALVVEAALPVRIILGFSGFSSEKGLRSAYESFLREHLGKSGFGVVKFPNLIICSQNSLLKMNGMPYLFTTDEGDRWACYASYFTNPLTLLLELIWTKLTYMYHIDGTNIFDDLNLERLHPFIIADTERDLNGWKYTFWDMDLRQDISADKWTPIIVDKCDFVVFNELCNKEYISIDDLKEWIEKESGDLDTFIKKYSSQRIIEVRDGKIFLLTKSLTCACLPNGEFAIGDNVNNVFFKWIQENFFEKYH